MAHKTVRRDWLLRQAKAGKLVAVSSYHFDDMFGESRLSKEMPVNAIAEWSEAKDGFCNILDWDFRAESGAAWRSEDETICLYVHSNCSYNFRVEA